MDLLSNQPQPQGFTQIRRAFDTAMQLPEWNRTSIRVGVCRGDGELLAVGTLNDRRQARLFQIQMVDMGYREIEGDAHHGCDKLYVPERWTVAQTAQQQVLASV